VIPFGLALPPPEPVTAVNASPNNVDVDWAVPVITVGASVVGIVRLWRLGVPVTVGLASLNSGSLRLNHVADPGNVDRVEYLTPDPDDPLQAITLTGGTVAGPFDRPVPYP